MSETAIKLGTDGRGVATLVLNRPEKRNAIGDEMLAAMAESLGMVERDPALRIVVIRAAGKHFCAGGDVSPSASHGIAGPSLPALCEMIAAFPKPTVAVVQGACLGGGLAIAGSCDILLAHDDASFALPEVRLGFAAAPLLPRLRRILGPRHLLRLGLTAERFDVEEALRIGLVHRRSTADAVDEVLAKIVEDLLLGAPGALSRMKSLCAVLGDEAATPALNEELQAAFIGMRDSAEGVEGRTAFREKRMPSWFPAADANRKS